MRGWIGPAAIAATVAKVATASGIVSVYNISDPTFGTCRLRGISKSSENFKYYASVPSTDYSLNSACARCITVSRDDNPAVTTTAYVLDVCDGCSSGTLALSGDSMAALNIDATDRTTSVSYRFGACPTSLMSGDIRACLMEGASATYVPLQLYNSQKVISGATIEGVSATSTSSSFLFSANSGSTSSTWYQNVRFSVTSNDGETLNSTFAFPSTSGCATSSVQFNSASTADGVTGNTSSGSSSGGVIGGVVGGVAAVLIIVGSIILFRRRKRAAKDFEDPGNDAENQFLSPLHKAKAATATVPTFSNDLDDPQRPASPTVDYAESFSPAASSKGHSARLCEMSSSEAPVVQPEPSAVFVPTSVAAASIAVDSSPSSFGRSLNSFSQDSSLELSPSVEPVYATPTYAFSNNVATSPHHLSISNVKAVPTLSAPVVPRQVSNTNYPQYGAESEEDRSSFDIDDMRESEARATMDLSRRLGSQSPFAPYSAGDSYASTVTSPESNVRGTSLRRPSFQQNSMRASGLDLGRYTNDSVLSDADSYASASRPTNQSILSNNTLLQSSPPPYAPSNSSLSVQPSGSTEADSTTDSMSDSFASIPAVHQNKDVAPSQPNIGSTRESGGYSRESLSILGYPYSKKSGRHHNLTEMQF